MDEADRAAPEIERLLAEQLRTAHKPVPVTSEADGFCQHCYAELSVAGALFCKPPRDCASVFRR